MKYMSRVEPSKPKPCDISTKYTGKPQGAANVETGEFWVAMHMPDADEMVVQKWLLDKPVRVQ